MNKLILTALTGTALVGTALTGTANAATPAATCGTLPAAVQGNPVVKPGSAGDLYLFHDRNAWNVRVTHASSSKLLVTGTITASNAISHLTTYKLEKGDGVTLSKDAKTLTFHMTNVGHLDGFGFSAECSHTLRVLIRVNGKSAPTTAVFLGAHKTHPTSVPFAVERH